MKNMKLLKAVLVISNLIALAACNETSSDSIVPSTPSSPISNSESSISEESSLPQSETVELVFNDIKTEYDGTAKSVVVENVPADATVAYTGNDKVEPGNYNVSAVVTFSDGSSKELSAKLTIEKCSSVLTAEAVQEAVNYGGALPAFSLSNTEQTVKVTPIYKPGVYELDLYAPATAHYKESNHITVSFTVRKGNDLGITFDSKETMYTGAEQSVVASNIPEGYHVEYVNNTATEQGKYYAVCKVYNDSTNELALTLNALLTIDNSEHEAFNEYLDEFFADYLGDDYIAWNIFTLDSEAFGLNRELFDSPKWYYYQSVDENYKEEAFVEMNGYYDLLKAFENEKLSYNQRISYKVLDDFFKENVEYYDAQHNYNSLMSLRFIDQFGGYAADFGTYMEAYGLRSVQDIEDVLSYIKSLPESFATYLDYASDRVDAGFPISDYTINEMIGYLEDVVDDGADYYLTDILVNKVNGCSFLDDSQKATYSEQIKNYMGEYFIPAYDSLAKGLEDYKGKCQKEGYLSVYGDAGREQFVYELRSLLGMPDLDMEEYGTYLKAKLDEYSVKINQVVAKVNTLPKKSYDAFFDLYDGGKSAVGIEDPNEMINYLKEFAKTIVPDLQSTPEITVKYMDDASAKVSNAVAYYMKSALDNTAQEYITLNGIQLSSDYNDTLSTMAHEGYPGHLYAYVYNKELDISNVAKIMTSTAHGEGWATYVSLKLFEYMKTHNTYDKMSQIGIGTYCDYQYYNQLLGYLAYTYIDYGIHYKGWGVNDVSSQMASLGFDSSMANDMYRTLIEMPAGYAAYGYGMSFMLDLHKDAEKQLGEFYDEVEFNSVVLSHGWCSLSELQRIVDEYIEETLFENNLISK